MNQVSCFNPAEIKEYSSYFNMLGNVPFDEAEIICIADNPGDSSHSQERLKVIQQVGLEALIFGEKIPVGEELRVPLATNFGRQEFSILGWDIPAMHVLVNDLDKELQKIYELRNCIKHLMNDNQWNSFRQAKGPFVTLLKKVSKDWRADWRETVNLMFTGDMHNFLYRIEHVISQAIVQNRIKKRELFKSTFQIRLRHLKYAMKKGLKSKKKVVISANSNFLLQHPFLKDKRYECGKMESFLRKCKFVILFPKRHTLEVMQSPSLMMHSEPL
jgi:hypothetical protein